MGCSFCKRELKLKMQIINHNSLSIGPNVQSREIRIKKENMNDIKKNVNKANQANNSSERILDKAENKLYYQTDSNKDSFNNQSHALGQAPESKQSSSYKADIEINNNSMVDAERSQIICVPSISENINSANIRASRHMKKNSTYKVIQSSIKSVNLKVYIAGFNSNYTRQFLSRKFVEAGLLVKCLEKTVSSVSLMKIEHKTNAFSSFFQVTEKGIELLNNLRGKKYRPSKNEISVTKTINNIIDNLIPSADITKQNLKGDVPLKKVFIDTNSYFIKFVSIEERIKSLELKTLLSPNNDNVKENILFLSFDYFKRASFDYIHDFIANSQLSGVKLLALGIKGNAGDSIHTAEEGPIQDKDLNAKADDYQVIKERTYEVNEDFAKLSFQTLEVEFFTVLTNANSSNKALLLNDQLEMLELGETFSPEKGFNIEERIFLSMFILNNILE